MKVIRFFDLPNLPLVLGEAQLSLFNESTLYFHSNKLKVYKLSELYITDNVDIIMKTRNVYPLKPHFYIVKLGYAGVYLLFLFFAPKHRLWVRVRTASARRF